MVNQYLIHKIVADPLHVRLLHCHAVPILQRGTTLDQQDPASASVLCGTATNRKHTFCSISLLLDIVALCWTSTEARTPLGCGLRSPLALYWARWLPDTLMDWRKGALCSSISGCTSPLAQCGPRCQPVWENFRVDGVQQPCREQASKHNQSSQVTTLASGELAWRSQISAYIHYDGFRVGSHTAHVQEVNES